MKKKYKGSHFLIKISLEKGQWVTRVLFAQLSEKTLPGVERERVKEVREDKKEGEKKHLKTRDDVMRNLKSIRRSYPPCGQKENMPGRTARRRKK